MLAWVDAELQSREVKEKRVKKQFGIGIKV